MHLLVLGGTLFLGRHVVEAALARDHRVTLFNRGTRPVAWAGVEQLTGDRDGGLAVLDGRRFDAVVDTSGYVPRLVGASARRLVDAVGHYTFVSSASVYADLSASGIGEAARVRTIDDPTNEEIRTHYGALKALCERAVDDALPGRALHVRAGLIVGPFDASGRFAYWVRRVADGGEVLAPGDPKRVIQFVHARDLAEWIVTMAETRRTGVFNATGPERQCTMRDLLDVCRTASGSDARFTWVDDAFLVAHDVAPFTEMPLWLPPSDAGLLALDVSKAIAAGLRFRPLAETVRDTLDWLRSSMRVAAPPMLASGASTTAGLTDARERTLLDAWRRAGQHPSRDRTP
jgi:2'-hydroxyisoflavone reductase